jgi:hypothetical protein
MRQARIRIAEAGSQSGEAVQAQLQEKPEIEGIRMPKVREMASHIEYLT